jgi:hypothetical protein
VAIVHRAAHADIEQAGQHGGIADFGMTIEREMGGVYGDIVPHESDDAPIIRACQWSQAAPKKTVMHQEKVGALLGCLSDRRFAEIHRGRNAMNRSVIADLKSVHGFYRIAHLTQPQVVLQINDDRMEIGHGDSI